MQPKTGSFLVANGVNHTEAALEFMRRYILPPNAHAQLVSMANTSKGMIFVFI